MRPDQQVYLAHQLRLQRERLEEVAAELAERGEPISELEARLLVEAANARLSYVESALRHDATRRGRTRRRGGTFARVRSWGKPRLGLLRHYAPKPLLVPAKYGRVAAPDPAPTISIVTPSFQQGQFLDRTIYSVLTQKYPALQYIVEDGASTDETVDVLRRFDGHLTGWRSEPDEGQGHAINRGFGQTSGEIMGWLNSDDLLLPGALAYVARYFTAHPEVDVVYGDRVMIDENDGQIGIWVLPRHDDLALTLADYIPQETLFWRRRIWDAVGGSVDASFDFALDWDLLLRFRAVGATIVHVPRFIGAFRVHEGQKTLVERSVGNAECERLRQRVHGRSVPYEEIFERLRPYFVRHIVRHTRQRILDRLPLDRQPVRTVPVESALKRPAEERRSVVAVPAKNQPVPVSPLAPTPDDAALGSASFPSR